MKFFARLSRHHLAPDEVISVAESLPGVNEEVKRHLLECAECRDSVDTMRETIALVTDDGTDAVLQADFVQADFVDWTRFQASVRERLLARSVRRDSWIRRWTGVAIAPGPATAWAVGALVLLSVLTVGGFRRFAMEPPVPGSIASESIDTASSESWFMIDEPDALDVEAIAWAQTDIFSTIQDLNAGEEEVLRALILEASDAADAEDTGRIE